MFVRQPSEALKPVVGWVVNGRGRAHDMHTSPACTYERSTGEVDPYLEVGPCLRDVVALGLHSGARTGLHQEDPRSQDRDLGHPSDFLKRYVLKAAPFKKRILTQTF
jgi:hypothetical protein